MESQNPHVGFSCPLTPTFWKAAEKAVHDILDSGGELDLQVQQIDGNRNLRQFSVLGPRDSVEKFCNFVRSTFH